MGFDTIEINLVSSMINVGLTMTFLHASQLQFLFVHRSLQKFDYGVLFRSCLVLESIHKILIVIPFGTRVRRSSWLEIGQLIGNDVSGHYKRHYFLSFYSFFFFFFFLFFFFSPSSTFLIEGGL